MSDLAKIIDNALHTYYQNLGINNYIDLTDSKGKFLKFIQDNGFDEDEDIEFELNDVKPEDCILIEFDPDFPINTEIWTPSESAQRKQQIIYYILQYCFQHHEAPTSQNIITFSNMDSEDSTDNYRCDGMDCTHITKLTKVMNSYYNRSKSDNHIEQSNLSLLEHFLHLIDKHNDEESFDAVHSQFNCKCDIKNCEMFNRNHRDRFAMRHKNTEAIRKTYDMHEDYDINELIKKQILDKIHCYYQHSYDSGFKLNSKQLEMINDIKNDHGLNDDIDTFLTNSEIMKIKQLITTERSLPIFNNKKYNQLLNSEDEEKEDKDNTDSNDTKMYSFGLQFKYGFDQERRWWRYAIAVLPKFSSLKEELTANNISIISIFQFDHEYKKAQIHFDSNYRKEKYSSMCLQHILSLMIYCNYTELSYQFSKTYREKFGSKHNNFYHLGKYVKISVGTFGTRTTDETTLYHGIGDILSFPRYIDQVRIFCPLSTTTSKTVAVNFTNNNNGLIIQFGSISPLFPKYYPVSWLSDYANESKCLFVQSQWPLTMVNIIDTKFGCEFYHVLNYLSIIDKIINSNVSVIEQLIFLTSQQKRLFSKVIENQLSYSLSSYKPFTLHEYAKKILKTYFSNKTEITMDFANFTRIKLPILIQSVKGLKEIFELFFCLDCEWINITNINVLYPNLECITIDNVNLQSSIIDNICDHIESDYTSRMQKIMIKTLSNSPLNVAEAINKYQQRFRQSNFTIRSPFSFSEDYDDDDDDEEYVDKNKQYGNELLISKFNNNRDTSKANDVSNNHKALINGVLLNLVVNGYCKNTVISSETQQLIFCYTNNNVITINNTSQLSSADGISHVIINGKVSHTPQQYHFSPHMIRRRRAQSWSNFTPETAVIEIYCDTLYNNSTIDASECGPTGGSGVYKEGCGRAGEFKYNRVNWSGASYGTYGMNSDAPAGKIYGNEELTKLYCGSGSAGNLVRGGGIIIISCNTFINSKRGLIKCNGDARGCSGGSVLIVTNIFRNYGIIEATGGKGLEKNRSNCLKRYLAGGDGRIAIYSSIREKDGSIKPDPYFGTYDQGIAIINNIKNNRNECIVVK